MPKTLAERTTDVAEAIEAGCRDDEVYGSAAVAADQAAHPDVYAGADQA